MNLTYKTNSMDLQIIQNKIFQIRGYKVMLDFHLAELYQVETRALKQAVKRNMNRFPPDFAFPLEKEEWKEVITNCDNLPEMAKYSPALPIAFTQEGIAMLSSVLRSEIAIQVNISIMRAFVVLRQLAGNYIELKTELENQFNASLKEIKDKVERLRQENEERFSDLDNQFSDVDTQFEELYKALTQMLAQKEKEVERRPIGYIQDPSNEDK